MPKIKIKDRWLLLIGIPLVGFIMPLIFNGFSITFIFSEGYRNLLMSLLNTVVIWLGIRQIVLYLWTRYPWEKYPLKHLIWEVILVFTYTMLVGLLTLIFVELTEFVILDEHMSLGMSITITLLITFFITSLHEAWFFYTQWNISLVKAESLEKENIISQYETLKSQINPHFLFNTLNTLTGLIEENPEAAVAYVGKTSDFLRSILSMRDREVISLEEEISIIDNFYHLQKERFGENLHITIDVPAESMKMNLPPLVLQMLVENAIKHNVISSEKPLHIHILATETDSVIVRNNRQQKLRKHNSNGIGLQNIRNRYIFLSQRQIEIRELPGSYEVKVPLLGSE
jgi:two-component system, LytTR family, sensor kinase